MTSKEIQDKVDAVLKEQFTQYDIDEIPDIENKPDSRLTHGNSGFLGEFTFLYVDMRGSSSFTDVHRLQTITKIYKAYHHCMVECIKTFGGQVRSFDGDRVLAIFAGSSKLNSAINCAMKMVGCRYDILQPKIKAALSNDKFSLGVGIATGTAMVSKAGVGYDKNTRDLIWIGDPPNLGSKLSDEADSPYSIYICKTSFEKLREENRYTTKDGIKTDMWTKTNFTFKNKPIEIYKTGYYRSL
ncbi:adenylate/guanylate cyclase domain-containing protein [Flavobacterium sp.]|jgi:adenylate cyclase|uniref:adenylate/guanylate cyclase domain-containing protein n=1 Tax=Flavobacterium sp. TaxID=239 RepID=UPI0037BE988B